MNLIRRPVAWVLFGAGALLSAWYAWRTFPTAFPIVTLDIRMDRSHALAAAESLAQVNIWGPSAAARQAASFQLDEETQTFVELEGGGKGAFTAMLHDGLYQAYVWQVRRFREGETNETLIEFTPAGQPYGFVEKLREDAPGPSLAADSAQRVAEAGAASWGINLDSFGLVEQSQEVRPGGRTDHTFTYERTAEKLGAGRYRLRLVVSGDRLTALTHFVHIPEAFTRRYEKMRSANQGIAFGAGIAFSLLYLLGGCVIGVAILMRQGWILWRQPLAWGILVAFLQLLAGINRWPLIWSDYDTALSLRNFVVKQVAALGGSFLLFASLFSLSFMAAESLTRRAFPHHPQLWRLWSPRAAASRQVLGRTLGGYLLVGYDLAYLVAFYLLVTRWLGWWNPSETLAQPDVLAHYQPWFSAVALPIQAGMWEESLFRAVPLAGAALLGDRYGGRRWWIVGALLLEAVVFGSGHATYAAQPAYARVVELLVPAVFYGIVYLSFGLLPAILVHFTYDAILFSLPLWVSNTSGIWIDRTLLVAAVLVPLGVVLAARLRQSAWLELDDSLRNGAWKPIGEPAGRPSRAKPVVPGILSPWTIRLLVVVGIAAVVGWARWTSFAALTAPMRIDRSAALTRVQQTFAARDVTLAPGFRLLTAVGASPGEDDRFVWQTAGPERYRALLGSYLDPPLWHVRAVSFKGDVAERAEEWNVALDGKGEVVRVRHQLPEGRSGVSLEQGEARSLAELALKSRYGDEAAMFKFVSMTPKALPARRDWELVVADTVGHQLASGELRIAVDIAGSEVVDVHRYVYVPEQWKRADRDRETVANLLDLVRVGLLIAGFGAGAVLGIIAWTRGALPLRPALTLLGIIWASFLLSFASRWPSIVAQFNSAIPFQLQATISIIGPSVGYFILAAGLSITATYAGRGLRVSTEGPVPSVLAGVGLGAIAAALLAMAARVHAASQPDWPGYGGAASFFPWLTAALSLIPPYVASTTAVLGVLAIVEGWASEGRGKRVLGILVLVAAGFFIAGRVEPGHLLPWLEAALFASLVIIVAYSLVLRIDGSLVPVITAALACLQAVRPALQGNYPGSSFGVTVGAALVMGIAVWWRGALREMAG